MVLKIVQEVFVFFEFDNYKNCSENVLAELGKEAEISEPIKPLITTKLNNGHDKRNKTLHRLEQALICHC